MDNGPEYYDPQGQPYTGTHEEQMFKWAADFEKRGDERFLAKTELWWGGRVSTVWLGLDHGFGARRPLIFETMLFPRGSYFDLDMERYSTRQEALAGHARMVSLWSKPQTLLRHIAERSLSWLSLKYRTVLHSLAAVMRRLF